MKASALFCTVAWAAQPTVELHGSGTTNPRYFYTKVMDYFMERLKLPAYMTYRAVGSSTGQYEFVGCADSTCATAAATALNHFGSGDIPMKQDYFDKLTAAGRSMVHVPVVMGAISIFHSVPEAMFGSSGEIDLSACLLAKIFSRQVTTWDHADILAENPGLKVPPGTNIEVVHRQHGSSSTKGTAIYLDKSCPASWSGVGMEVGSTITWAADTITAQGSDGMSNYLKANPFAIAYIDAGHGHRKGLTEVALQNFNGKYIKAANADVGAAGKAALSGTTPLIPADPSATWAAVDLYDMPGDSTWPITGFSYFYLEKDLSGMAADTAGLLKAFIEYTLSAEGQAEAEACCGFSKLDAGVLTYNDATLAAITWPAGMPAYTFETAGTTQKGTGQGDRVISGKRRSYADYHRELLSDEITALTGEVAALKADFDTSRTVEFHGSGTTNPSKYLWKAMDLFEERAKFPIYSTYRAIGSGGGQHEFVNKDNPAAGPLNHFGAGDIPMTNSNYNLLSSPMVHIPFVMGAISVFHSVPASVFGSSGEIDLSGCLLAKIFSRKVKTWDHPDVLAENPGLKVPAGTNIKVVHRVGGSSSTSGTTQYLDKACAASWSQGTPAMEVGKVITWPADTFEPASDGSDGITAFLKENEYAIGYLDAGHGQAKGLTEVALMNKAGKYIKAKNADIGAAGAAALSTSPSIIPSDPSADWSAVDLYDMPGDTTWPITMFSYFYVRKDVSDLPPKTAAVLKGFIEFTLSQTAGEGQDLITEFGFSKLAPALLNYNADTIASMKFPQGMTPLEFESSKIYGAGAKREMISSKRITYADYDRGLLQDEVTALKMALKGLAAETVGENVPAESVALKALVAEAETDPVRENVALKALVADNVATIATLTDRIALLEEGGVDGVGVAGLVVSVVALGLGSFALATGLSAKKAAAPAVKGSSPMQGDENINRA